MRDVTSRKMFRKSDARNRLRQMGGIMSSSPELMQTVQKFNIGGPVNTQQRINQANRSATIPGANYIQDFVNMANAQSGIANMPTTPQGAFRSPKVEGPTGGQVLMGQVGDYLGDVFGPETPEEVQQRVAGARSVGETFGVPENAPIRNVVPEFLKPQEGPARGIFTDMTLEEKAAAVGLGPEAGRRITDPEEIARLQNTPEGIGQSPSGIPRPGADDPTMRGPTAEDIRPDRAPSPEDLEEGMGEGLVPGFKQKGASTRDQLADTPTEAEIEAGVVDPVEAGKEFADKVVVGMRTADSQTEANDLALEAGGVKDPEEKLTLKERYDRNIELYKQIFNEDPEEDKKIDGYNLAMMGFLIASGDSPNALQNIAKGAAAGTDNFRKTAQARQDRKEKIKTFALQNALDSQNSELQWEREMEKFDKGLQFKWITTLRGERADKENLAARLAAQRANLITNLAENRREGRETRAAAVDRALISNFDDAMSAAIFSAQEEGLDWKSDDVFNNQIIPRARQIATSLPTGASKLEAMPSLQEYVMENTADALKNLETQDMIARELGVEPNQLRSDQIQNFYTNLYRNSSGAQNSQGSQSTQSVPSFDQQPSDTELRSLYDQGVRQVTIGGQTFPLQLEQ